MVALISFLFVVALSLLLERIAAVALTLTGLSRDSARFQARSALTGTGFTTGEAEQVVRHPVRRRIVGLLMYVQSLGIVTGVSSLILSFAGAGVTAQGGERALLLVAGLAVLWVLAASPWVDRHLSALIARALRRWTHIDVRDYTALLRLTGGYTVLEMHVHPGSWMAGRRLGELDLPEEGVVVLGIQRADGGFVGAPRGHSAIHPREPLILYGRADRLEELDRRRAGVGGDRAHREAVRERRHLLAEQGRGGHTPEEGGHEAHDGLAPAEGG